MRNVWIMAFLTFFCAVLVSAQETKPEPKPAGSGSGSGSGSGGGNFSPIRNDNSAVSPLRILSKPRANYTEAARENGVEGVVRLRVTFLARGEIGSVSAVSGLPFGLTEQAIAAANEIRFTPAIRNDQPISVTKVVEYNFWLFYDENDRYIKHKAKILEKPNPEHPQAAHLAKLRGKVKLVLGLRSDGTVSVASASTDLPKEFEEKAREAAAKIKFNPAVHKNGNKVTQAKEVEYEFKPQN